MKRDHKHSRYCRKKSTVYLKKKNMESFYRLRFDMMNVQKALYNHTESQARRRISEKETRYPTKLQHCQIFFQYC